jgi:mono/diheme cytochrome c family protein
MTLFHRFILALAVAGTVASSGCVHDRRSDSPSHYSGEKLYAVYCASCHGLDGYGAGPVEPFIAAHAPNLTQIAVRNGGKFPREQVFRTIDGQFESPRSNTRHMPIWGYDLFTGEGDDETAHQQVLDLEHRIVKYVESIQETAPQ